MNIAQILLLRYRVEQVFVPARLLLTTIQEAGEKPIIRVIDNPGGWPKKEYSITSTTLTTEHRFYKEPDVSVILDYLVGANNA